MRNWRTTTIKEIVGGSEEVTQQFISQLMREGEGGSYDDLGRALTLSSLAKWVGRMPQLEEGEGSPGPNFHQKLDGELQRRLEEVKKRLAGGNKKRGWFEQEDER